MSTSKLWIVLISVLFSLSAQASYQVGVGVTDLTPKAKQIAEGDLYLGGFGFWKERGPAVGVHDPVTARAVYIGSGSEELCILIIDSVGVPSSLANQIAALASARTGIDKSRIMVGATHSHTAPDVKGLFGGTSDAYMDHFIDQSVAAVTTAFQNRRAAQLRYASTIATGANNRRGWGYTDDELVVLDAVDEKTAERIVTLINFAAHPVLIADKLRQVSSGFIHYLRVHAEAKLGAPVVYINGATGDASPKRPDGGGDDYYKAETYGVDIADQALAVLPNLQPVAEGIVFERRQFSSPVDNWMLIIAHSVGLLNANISGPLWSRQLSNSVAYFSLGKEIQAVTMPGEALTRTSLPIKKRMTAPAKLFLGLSGGSIGYLVPSDEWLSGRHNGYEESVSISSHASDQLSELLLKMLPN